MTPCSDWDLKKVCEALRELRVPADAEIEPPDWWYEVRDEVKSMYGIEYPNPAEYVFKRAAVLLLELHGGTQ